MSNQFTELLNDALVQGPIGVYVGAGVSCMQPSNLPSWYVFNRNLLDTIHRQAQRAGHVWSPLLEELEKRIDTSELPGIYLSQVIVDRIGDEYFSVLECLNSEEPNAIHYWLAQAAKQKRLSVVITTNFDMLIETAFEKLDVDYISCVTEDEFKKTIGMLNHREAPTYLWKIHGSLGHEDYHLVDTLAQRLKGLPVTIGRAMEAAFTTFPFFFFGTSGGDLQAGGDYLHIRRSSGVGLELYWLFLNESVVSKEVKETVAFARSRGGKAAIVIGRLPDDLPVINGHPEGEFVPNSVQTRFSMSEQGDPLEFSKVIEKWGRKLGFTKACLILCDYAEHIGRWDLGARALETIIMHNVDIRNNPRVLLRLAELLSMATDRQSWYRALELLRKAKRRSGDIQEQGEIHQVQGRILTRFSYFDDALDAFTNASEKFGKDSRPAQHLSALLNRAVCLKSLGQWRDAVQEYLNISQQAGDLGYPLIAGRVLYETGKLLRFFEGPDSCVDILDKAERFFQQVGAIGDLASLQRLRSDIAVDQGNWESAIDYANRSIDLYEIAEDLEGETRALALLAEALHRKGKRDAARVAIERAIEVAANTSNEDLIKTISNKNSRLWEPIGKGDFRLIFSPERPEEEGAYSPESRWKFFMKKAQLAARQLRYRDTFDWMAKGALEISGMKEPMRTQRRIGQELHFGIFLNSGNNPRSALQHFNSARRILEEIGDREFLIQVVANQADAFRRSYVYNEALATYAEGLSLVEHTGKPTGGLRAQMKYYIAIMLGAQGKITEASRLFLEVIEDDEIKEAIGFRLAAYCRLVHCLLDLSKIEEAKHFLDQATLLVIPLLEAVGTMGMVKDARFLVCTARIKLLDGDQMLAEKALARACKRAGSFFSEQKDPENFADACYWLGQIYKQQRPYESLRWYKKALECWDDLQHMNQRAHTLLAGAETLGILERHEEAIEMIVESEEIFTRHQNGFGLGCCLLMKAKIAARNGNLDQARALAHDAKSKFPDGQVLQACAAGDIIAGSPSLFGRATLVEVLRLEGNSRILLLWLGEIEHAVYSRPNVYDGIFLCGRTAGRRELRDAPRTRKLNQASNWSALEQIEEVCKEKGWHKVASMPFGGKDNGPLINWLERTGSPRELHIYYVDPNDYADIGAFIT